MFTKRNGLIHHQSRDIPSSQIDCSSRHSSRSPLDFEGVICIPLLSSHSSRSSNNLQRNRAVVVQPLNRYVSGVHRSSLLLMKARTARRRGIDSSRRSVSRCAGPISAQGVAGPEIIIQSFNYEELESPNPPMTTPENKDCPDCINFSYKKRENQSFHRRDIDIDLTPRIPTIRRSGTESTIDSTPAAISVKVNKRRRVLRKMRESAVEGKSIRLISLSPVTVQSVVEGKPQITRRQSCIPKGLKWR